MIDLMNKKLLTDIDQLPMHNPGIQLMVKYLMAAEKYLGKHVFDNWVSTGTLLVKGIQYLTTPLRLFFDFVHQVQKCGKHLKVDAKLLLEREHGERPVLKVLPLDGQNMFLVNGQHLVDPRAESLHVNAV